MATHAKRDDKSTSDEPNMPIIAVVDGPEHGYIGQLQDPTPNEEYTLRGQVGKKR